MRELLIQYDLDNYSHIILGCTHFPIVKENIEMILKEMNKDIKVIDGNEGIGKNLLKKIEERGSKENKFSLNIITTAKNSAFEKRVNEILGDIDYIINYNFYLL